MSFAMPSAWTLATLPEPTDPRVTLREAPPRQVAVLRFSGLWSDARFAEQERLLRAQLATSGWQVTGPAESLRYDPPWTLWFLRRNEVALPVLAPGIETAFTSRQREGGSFSGLCERQLPAGIFVAEWSLQFRPGAEQERSPL